MSEIKKYEFSSMYGSCVAEEDDRGEWVKAEDHKSLVQQLQSRIEAKDSALELYANDDNWSDMGDIDGWHFSGAGSFSAKQALKT